MGIARHLRWQARQDHAGSLMELHDFLPIMAIATFIALITYAATRR